VIAQILFYMFAAVLVAAALGVITSRNPVYSALFLVLAFVQSAALWLLIEAEFLAVVLVLVYVGAVMVLFLFVVMMLDINVEEMREGFTRYVWLGAAVAIGVIAEIVYVLVYRAEGFDFVRVPEPYPADYSNATELGVAVFTEHLYAFEIAGFILLLAIVAAISLTMRKREGLKVQNVSAQVAVRRQDRVRIVQVEASKE
jgi:NADH-quinone oxidoreductase subunit J